MRLIGTEILPGMGLGNMLLAYVSIRGLARELNAEFAILGKELLISALSEKDGQPFLTLDYGISAKKEDFARVLHEHEDRLFIGNSTHDLTHGCYLSGEDRSLHSLDPEGGVLIYGNLQAEGYFGKDLELLSSWLPVAEGFSSPLLRGDARLYEACDEMKFARMRGDSVETPDAHPHEDSDAAPIFPPALCVINLRGGEYTGSPELFLCPGYFRDAMRKMRELKPDMEFFVVTDDPEAAGRILPEIPAAHFSVSGDYLSIKNARYLILSNSSFALLPAFTNPHAELIIAPKYWARHNVSPGYWSGEQNIYSPLRYLDREGRLFTPEECRRELAEYKKLSPCYKRLNTPLSGSALSLAKAKAFFYRKRDMAARILRSLARRLGFYRHRQAAVFLLLILLLGILAAVFFCSPQSRANPAPALIPSPKGWDAGHGSTALSGGIVCKAEGARAAAALLREGLHRGNTDSGLKTAVIEASDVASDAAASNATVSDAGDPDRTVFLTDSVAGDSRNQKVRPGDIVLSENKRLPGEGYSLGIGETIRLEASSPQGFLWGAQTILSMLRGKPSDAFSLPRGRLSDAPAYSVRGISMDVARKPVSINALRRLLRVMSAYKLNELTLHLNDNELLVYSGKTDSLENAHSLYGAYRMESSLVSEKGASYTSEDLFYAKDEFFALVQEAALLGIRLIPEIDAPAHCLAFTAKSPSLSLPAPEAADQLNLGKTETWELIDSLWTEQEKESFSDCPVVHIGGDEYYGSPDEYLGFMEYIAQQREKAGKTVRFWGSLSRIRGTGALPSPGSTGVGGRPRELVIWNTDWADPREMAQRGFSLINANHGELYLIPGGGQDRLEKERFYLDFRVDRFPLDAPDGTPTGESVTLEPGKVLGAELALWNDFSGTLENGMDEEDMLERLFEAIPYLAEKTWHGAEQRMPFAEFAALADSSLQHANVSPLAESSSQHANSSPQATTSLQHANSSPLAKTSLPHANSSPLVKNSLPHANVSPLTESLHEAAGAFSQSFKGAAHDAD